MSAHAILPPSSAARWVACAGSVMLAALYPQQEETQASLEGTAAHWAASEMLEGRLVDVGQVAPNGVVLNDEMIEAAELYVATVDGKLAQYGLSRDFLHVEETIKIDRVHEHNWGTPDCWFYAPAHGVLVVLDFKYGHRYVEVFENWQLLDYACGIMDSLGIDGMADQSLRVDFIIVQPRSYHKDGPVRTWSPIAASLRGCFNVLASAAGAALQPGAQCKVNAECRDCPGRHACQALQTASLAAVDIAKHSTPLELPAPALARELQDLRRAADLLAARISGLEETTIHRIKGGERVPGFALEPVVGRLEWSVPVPQVLALGSIMGKELSKPTVVTPTQAIKLGLDEATVASMSTRKNKGVTLVLDDGKQAKKVFG